MQTAKNTYWNTFPAMFSYSRRKEASRTLFVLRVSTHYDCIHTCVCVCVWGGGGRGRMLEPHRCLVTNSEHSQSSTPVLTSTGSGHMTFTPRRGRTYLNRQLGHCCHHQPTCGVGGGGQGSAPWRLIPQQQTGKQLSMRVPSWNQRSSQQSWHRVETQDTIRKTAWISLTGGWPGNKRRAKKPTLSCHENTEQNHDSKMDDTSFEIVKQF
jgi:hypothetical protein